MRKSIADLRKALVEKLEPYCGKLLRQQKGLSDGQLLVLGDEVVARLAQKRLDDFLQENKDWVRGIKQIADVRRLREAFRQRGLLKPENRHIAHVVLLQWSKTQIFRTPPK